METVLLNQYKFPSPLGVKFQFQRYNRVEVIKGFRPLTGLNFNVR